MLRGKERADMKIILMYFYCDLLDIKVYLYLACPKFQSKSKANSAKHTANVLHGGGV